MKSIVLLATMLSSMLAPKEKVSLPIKDNRIHYSNVVITTFNTNPSTINDRVNEWVAANTAQYSLSKQQEATIGNLVRMKGKLAIDPDKKNVHNVDCEFTMDISIIDGRYRVEVYDLFFLKADQRFDASEVYNSCQRGDAFVKTALESKDAAMQRHLFLLQVLDNNVQQMLASLQQTVDKL